ncbi:hypothetical protein O0L34_g653 [Tuta absoluta]|nr:hypothetical protein O0L34_g653 [Tuta absoluta]
MSKRPLDMNNTSPNIVICPDTVIISDDESSPPKKSKLPETSPPIPQKANAVLDSTGTAPPFPKVPTQSETVLQSEKVKPSERVMFSENTIKDTDVSKCVPSVSKKYKEAQAKEAKTAAKPTSWASNYLRSIGPINPINKSIKINMTSHKKESEELNQIKCTENDASNSTIEIKNIAFPTESTANETIVPKTNLLKNEITNETAKNSQPNIKFGSADMLYAKTNTYANDITFPIDWPTNKTLDPETNLAKNKVTNANDTVINSQPNIKIIPPGMLYATKHANSNDITFLSPDNETLVSKTNPPNNDANKKTAINSQSNIKIGDPDVISSTPVYETLVSNTNSCNNVVSNETASNLQPRIKTIPPDMLNATAKDARETNNIGFSKKSSPRNATLVSNPSYNNIINESITNPQPNFEIRHPEMLYAANSTREERGGILFPSRPLNETLVSMNYPSSSHFINTSVIHPQHCFEIIHPDMLNRNTLYSNCCTNFQNQPSMYAPNSFIGYEEWRREPMFNGPAEDKSYLDKVDQFLSKIKYNSQPKSKLDTRSQEEETKPLLAKKRDIPGTEIPQKIKTSTNIDDQIHHTQYRDDIKHRLENIKKTIHAKRDGSRLHSEINKRYDIERDGLGQLYTARHKENIKLKERESDDHLNIRSTVRGRRREYYHQERTEYNPNPSLMHMSRMPPFKRRESSEAYKDCSNDRLHKRERLNSSTIDHERPSRHIINEKRATERNFEDSSDSSDCSMPCCTRNKRIKQTERSTNSRHSDIRIRGSPQNEPPLAPKTKEHKSRRDRSKSSSGSEASTHRSSQNAHKNKFPNESYREKSPPKTYKIEQHKSRRDRQIDELRSNSSKSESCQSEKIKINDLLERERSVSSSKSRKYSNDMPYSVRNQDKKRKRSSSRTASSDRSRSPTHKNKEKPENRRSPSTHKNKEKPEKRIKTKISKSSHKGTDSNKSSKMIKDLVCKDNNKITVPTSKQPCKEDKCMKFESATDSTKMKSQCATTMHRCKENTDTQAHTKESTVIKSVVQIKDRDNSRYSTHDEHFDLRSKLSRKGLNNHFSKLCKTETKVTDHRENLVITVSNEDEENITVSNKDEAKGQILKTAKDKLIKLSQMKFNNAKNKKLKKFKLVINVICNSSQSSDSDNDEEMSCKNAESEHKNKDTVMEKFITEHESNDLSFLDDLNIDEIVASLTCNKDESTFLNKATDASITLSSSSPEMRTFIVSDSESDASTVHLEELREMHDILQTDENIQRISSDENKFNAEDKTMDIKAEKDESDIKMLYGNEIKQEMIYEENNDISNDKRTESRKDNIESNKAVTNEIKEEPTEKVIDGSSKIFETKRHLVNGFFESKKEIEQFNFSTKDNDTTIDTIMIHDSTMIHVNKVKEEPADRYDSSILLFKSQKETKESEQVNISTKDNDTTIDTVMIHDSTMIYMNKVKEEPADRDDSLILMLESKNEIKQLEKVNISTKDNDIPINKVKEEPEVQKLSKLPSTTNITEKSDDQSKTNRINPISNENKETEPNFVSAHYAKGYIDSLTNNVFVPEVKKEPNGASCDTDVLKNYTKENASKVVDSNSTLVNKFVPQIDIKRGLENVEHYTGKFLPGVSDSKSVTNILQLNVGNKNETAAIRKKIPANCAIQQIRDPNVENTLIFSNSIDLTQESHLVKEEPISDTENGDLPSNKTPVPAHLEKGYSEELKYEESQNFKQVPSETKCNEYVSYTSNETKCNEDVSYNTHLSTKGTNSSNHTVKSTGTKDVQNTDHLHESSNTKRTVLASSKQIIDKSQVNKEFSHEEFSKNTNSFKQIEKMANTSVIQKTKQLKGSNKSTKSIPACSKTTTELNNNDRTGFREVADNARLNIKIANRSDRIVKSADSIQEQNMKQLDEANISIKPDPEISKKDVSQKVQDNEKILFNFYEIKGVNNKRIDTVELQNTKQTNINRDFNTPVTGRSEKDSKSEDISESENVEQMQTNCNESNDKKEVSDNTDYNIKPADTLSKMEMSKKTVKLQNTKQIKLINVSGIPLPVNSIKENLENKNVLDSTDLKTKVTCSNKNESCTDIIKKTKQIKKVNNSPLPLKTTENVTVLKSATGTAPKVKELTESKTVVSTITHSDNTLKEIVAGVKEGQHSHIESGNNNVSENNNIANSLNKNMLSATGTKILKPQQNSNAVKNDHLPDKVSATKSRYIPPIMRAKSTQFNPPTNKSNSNRSAAVLQVNPIDVKFIEALESRLFHYLGEQYTVDDIIHRGTFSKIFKCYDAKGQNYVAKVGTVFGHNRHVRGIAMEKILASLQKDIPEANLNFVRLINGLEISGQWCYLMEYCPKNLTQVLKENNKPLHINTVQLLSKQLVAAVTILRHHNVVHSDIKPEHILLNYTEDRLKLCGFDCAYYNENPVFIPGTKVNYRAPETILRYSSGYSIDVWSTALVMYEMATRRKLFPGYHNNDILFKHMCTRGYIPADMIRNSRLAYKHFQGNVFMRRVGEKGQTIVCIDEQQIYRNNLLESTIKNSYYKEWGLHVGKQQKREETLKVACFHQLLEQMLVVHPNYRLPIENVYAHPFLFEYND